ncbi:MAG TPA: ABC transporter ATP-binding protein [Candidatus Saccharimonadales bacterium]|nr:ABC transporter ATP-binding protein [Candidatus Saccharimonadales bacterium]
MRILFKVLKSAGNLWPYYLAIAAFSVVLSLASLAIPFLIKAATDLTVMSLQTGRAEVSGIVWIAVIILGVEVATTILSNFAGYFGDMMAAKLRQQLSERYYAHLLKLPQSYFDRELTGTIINRLNRTIMEVTQFLNAFANNFFQMILMIILVLIIVGFYSWQLAILLFVVYPIFLYLTMLTSRKWQVYQKQKNLETDVASGRFAEVVSSIRVVKSFIRESLEKREFSHHFSTTVDITKRQSSYWHKMDVSRRLVLNLIFFMVYAYIFVATVQSRFTIGEMVLLIQLVNMVRMPIFSMSFIVDNAQRAIAGSVDYFEVMAIEPDLADKPAAQALKVTRAAVTYDRVNFAYQSGQSVLKNLDFSIKPGEKVALVGESGEGKTTITNLLLRLYDPNKGRIVIDDQDIANVTQASLRDNIAVVFQEPALFSGTIRENIAYGQPGATDKAIRAAAKAANALEFIDKFELGFDTTIGERGLKLSGGQKQRIAIARAALKDAPILVLDEATSSLDSRSEHLVQQALERLMKRRTTLIIAHRLSTIAHVDRIITLKGGRVDEIGTPNKLAKSGGIYQQLLELQSTGLPKAKEELKHYGIADA